MNIHYSVKDLIKYMGCLIFEAANWVGIIMVWGAECHSVWLQVSATVMFLTWILIANIFKEQYKTWIVHEDTVEVKTEE